MYRGSTKVEKYEEDGGGNCCGISQRLFLTQLRLLLFLRELIAMSRSLLGKWSKRWRTGDCVHFDFWFTLITPPPPIIDSFCPVHQTRPLTFRKSNARVRRSPLKMDLFLFWTPNFLRCFAAFTGSECLPCKENWPCLWRREICGC